MALDPRTLKVVYLEPFFVSDEGNTNAFLEHLVETYGQWPKLGIVPGSGVNPGPRAEGPRVIELGPEGA